MWIVCITSVRHVLTVNGYGGRQTKENEKSWCFKGWETLVSTFHLIATANVSSTYHYFQKIMDSIIMCHIFQLNVCFSAKIAISFY